MNKIYVFGHQKPDTDSVTSSIALSYLKNQLGLNTEARILSNINKETKFVLKYFKVKKPRYLDSVKLQLKDIEYHRNCYMNYHASLNDTYNYLIDNQITGVPIVNDVKKLMGIVTIKNFVSYIKNRRNYLHTYYDHIINILGAEEYSRVVDDIKGFIKIKDDCIFIVNDSINTIIMTKYSKASYKSFKKVNIIYSVKDMVDIIRLLPWCNCVEDVIAKERIANFQEDIYYDDFIKETNKLKFNNYPVVGKNGICKGLIRITEMNKKNKKQVILVDHNEPNQSVDGLEEAEILEIIDHHKIGTTTNNPISFRNMTVGSTNTIVYQMYKENSIEIPYDIAGLMLSGILSDTLGLTSSTTTETDVKVINELLNIVKLDYQDYYYKMLEAGTSLEGETKEQIIKQDLKYFQVNNSRYAISQAITLNINDILKDKDDYIKILEDFKANNDLSLMIFIITDAIKNGSYLLYTKDVEDIIKDIYDLDEVYQGVFINNLTSRKKQVVPYINEYLK